MATPVIVSAVRTPVGTARKGSLSETTAEVLATHVLREAVERSGLPGERFDDVIFAESMYGGGDVARYAAVAAGLRGVPGVAVNRHCAGGLTSTGLASAMIMSGMADAIVAGGVQSSSLMPRASWRTPGTEEWRDGLPATFPYTDDANDDTTLNTGFNIAQFHGITREEMDAWAVRSHRRAIAAIDAGHFDAEIAPIKVTLRDGSLKDFAVDEHPRRDTSLERLATLPPLHPEIEGFSITAGNASGNNDAASALAITSQELAEAEGLDALAEITYWTSAAGDPKYTGNAAITVIEKVLAKTGLSVGDVDLWEINEAFAVVPVAVCKVLGLDQEKVNPFGSGCSIGHPISASGGRMMATLVHALRRRGGGIGVAAMCAGGGQGGAVVVRVD